MNDQLRRTNLFTKFGRFFTPVSIVLLAMVAGICVVVIKIILENL